MTEKRYVSDVKNTEKEVRIFDLEDEKKIFNIFFNELDSAICLNGALGDVVTLLNEQHETIQEKQHTINEMTKALRTYDDGYIGLNKENQRLLKANMELTEENTNLLSTIRTAYQNERTNIGRMVLKQLMEQIE